MFSNVVLLFINIFLLFLFFFPFATFSTKFEIHGFRIIVQWKQRNRKYAWRIMFGENSVRERLSLTLNRSRDVLVLRLASWSRSVTRVLDHLFSSVPVFSLRSVLHHFTLTWEINRIRNLWKEKLLILNAHDKCTVATVVKLEAAKESVAEIAA